MQNWREQRRQTSKSNTRNYNLRARRCCKSENSEDVDQNAEDADDADYVDDEEDDNDDEEAYDEEVYVRIFRFLLLFYFNSLFSFFRNF